MTPARCVAQAAPVRFSASIRLTKREAFDACQALADADRFLLRAGQHEAAAALGDLFELLEERLTADSAGWGSALSDSKSNDQVYPPGRVRRSVQTR